MRAHPASQASLLLDVVRSTTTVQLEVRPTSTQPERVRTTTAKDGSRFESDMEEQVRTDSVGVHSVNSVQDVQRPYLRKCTTGPQRERLAALRGVAEPLTPARIITELGWLRYEAERALQDLSARGYLRGTPRGHVWTEEGRAA